MKRINLDPESIRSYSSIGRSLSAKALERFKSLTEKGCIPLHIRSRKWRGDISVSARGEVALEPQIKERAKEIVGQENDKLRESGVEGGWIDGEKLAVQGIKAGSKEIKMNAALLRWSEILAMKDLPFDGIAELKAFKLDTNTHVIARDGRHKVLLVGQRGRKPGEKRMGSEALMAPVGSEVQWTLATNGVLDKDVLDAAGSPEAAWMDNSLKEFHEELGVKSREGLEYLGLMVDPHMFVGALGILGAIDSGLTPRQIDRKRKAAMHRQEVPELDMIPMEESAIATYLRVNRSSMVPQLVTGLVVLGYRRWGEGFLASADR